MIRNLNYGQVSKLVPFLLEPRTNLQQTSTNMPTTFRNRLLLLIATPLLFSACISNKKHLAAIDLINTTHSGEVLQLESEIDTRNNTIKDLELKLAERIGENNILLMLRDELTIELETLEGNIKNLSSSSSSTEKNLSADLAKKEQYIKELKAHLTKVETTIVAHEDIIKQITGNLNFIAQDYPDDIDVGLGYDFATIEIKESFLFKRKSTTRLEDSGLIILEKFSEIFQQHPNIKVQVIGHTDTAPPSDKKRYTDNWNFSALQSATIVRTLVDEYDVNSNQLTVAAKGESAPRASNSTTEGKSNNRRIEFYITMNSEDLAKKVRAVLAEVK